MTALPTPADMIGDANEELSTAYRALGDAAACLRSDWRRRPTAAEVEQIDRMRKAIAAAKAAINEGRP